MIQKRDGRREAFQRRKAKRFIDIAMHKGRPLDVDPDTILTAVAEGMPKHIDSASVARYISSICAAMTFQHHDYSVLAARVEMCQLHKQTSPSFTRAMEKVASILDPSFLTKVHLMQLDDVIDHSRDFQYDIMGLQTLKRSYLLRDEARRIVERPQYMLMRVACALYDTKSDIVNAYNSMKHGLYTHATPTLFNAGMKRGQLASCFLMDMKEDSIKGIYETLQQTAEISKSAGGIGLSITKIRSTGSNIQGTNGTSNGIVPMLRVFNATARYCDQGGGKRKGSFAMYIEPWHADIRAFLELKKNTGTEEERCRDLFFALWTNRLFMQRVKENGPWQLHDPKKVPHLVNLYGEAFEKAYVDAEPHAVETMQARDLWTLILQSQIETGTPYLLNKDECNEKSNQKNLGTIHCSNLCAEVVEYSSPDEISVCTLASIALPKFVDGTFLFQDLGHVVEEVVRNLNMVIDKTHYPVPEAKANLKHRPIGIGVQGLADVFQMLHIPYDSDKAVELDTRIHETIYFHALKASNTLAKIHGAYESFQGSPASGGVLQHDLWNVPGTLDWQPLRDSIRQHGLRNSLLVALMPTASSAQILGNTESFEPRQSNLFVRRVLSGEYQIVNKYLQRECIRLGIWDQVKEDLVRDKGSVQNADVPQYIKDSYKTVWEMSQKALINHAAARAPFVDQSMSLNLYLPNPTVSQLSSMHFYSFRKGLKTMIYYLRTRPKADSVAFTAKKKRKCTEDVCDMCSA